MTSDLVVFLVLGVVAVGAALGMLFSRNAIYSALFLILNFATIAVFYLLLGGTFIAMAQITVYAGAIMVLFLFVIMLLGAEQLSGGEASPWQRPLAIVLGVVLLAESALVIFTRNDVLPVPAVGLSEFGSPAAVGDILFNQYLLPFEVTSVLLLIAMVGAIVLTRDVK